MGKTLSNRFTDFGPFLIGALMLTAALLRYRMFFNLVHLNHLREQAIVLIYFVSAIITVLGLFRLRAWGFVAAYIHIITATIYLSVSVIPYVFKYLKFGNSTISTLIMISNLLVLILIAFLHGRRGTAG